MTAANPHRIERLRRDVERLATPAGRMVGTPGHAAARDHLVERLAACDLRPYCGGGFRCDYIGTEQGRFSNLLGVLPGEEDGPPLVLVAHYDTCGPLPGADDNAAAVAMLLESVAPLRALRLPRPILFALVDAEEPPHFLGPDMGSNRFYREQRVGPVHGAIVLDLVGHDVPIAGLEDVVFLTGMESDADWEAAIASAVAGSGQRVVPVSNRLVGDLSDHHVFRLARRPYVFLSCGHWEHYHTSTDTPEKLSYDKMARVTDFIVAVAAAAATAPLAGPFEGWDSTPVELRYLEEVAGPVVRALGLQLRDGADIERVVATLVRRFGL
jgi:hypothetical protein